MILLLLIGYELTRRRPDPDAVAVVGVFALGELFCELMAILSATGVL